MSLLGVSPSKVLQMCVYILFIFPGTDLSSKLCQVMTSEINNPSKALTAELESVKTEIPKLEDVKLIAAVPQLVRSEIL